MVLVTANVGDADARFRNYFDAERMLAGATQPEDVSWWVGDLDLVLSRLDADRKHLDRLVARPATRPRNHVAKPVLGGRASAQYRDGAKRRPRDLMVTASAALSLTTPNRAWQISLRR